MYCNQCGAEVEDNVLVCPNCGHLLVIEPRGPEQQEPSAGPEESAEPTARSGGCGWAMIAGMLAGCAILLILGVGLLGIYQGIQERTRLNRAAAIEHYHKGLEYFIAENYELAREEFALALQLDPKHSDAAAKLSEVETLLSKMPTPTSAVRYQTAILLYNEARELYNKGDWEGVITKLEQVHALDPEYEQEQVSMLLVEAYYKAGLKLVEENRLEEAIRYFDRALQLRPAEQAIRAQKRLATLYLAGLGYWGADWEGAIEVFQALYQLQPDYKDTRQRLYDAHVSYANVLAAKGEWCAARDQYDRALAMSFSDELKAKREEAAQSCAVALLPTSTPPPSGTFVGRVVKIDDVGLQTAMMIRGQVLNAEGKPIPNVQVGLSAWDWSAPPATTNQEGIFAFDGLGNPVTYTVTLINLPAVPLPVKADWSKLVWVEFRPQP
ncbi:MAG: tetratricopeptide repeat protein [Anaerolineae bacterium]